MEALQPQSMRIPSHDGLLLNVNYYGGAGRPVLFTHYVGGLSRVWEPVIAQLRDRYRVYALDMRGHGLSELPKNREACNWPGQGRDVLSVLDALGLNESMLAVGLSGGAAHLAYAEMFRPGLFERVVLFDAIIRHADYDGTSNYLSEGARRRRNVFDSCEDARARFAAKPPMNTWCPEALDLYIAHALKDNPDGTVGLRLPGEVESWFFELGGAPDLFERLGDLNLNALLVSGTRSEILPWVEQQAPRLRHAQLEIVPGAGHFLPFESPQTATEIILRGLGTG